ncbi:MAG: ASPIC/UnbV domain protein [Myxococcales bacterium]|nr:ASPIC/UnbV domain protein [Myxococcales bacterium]
MLGGCGAGADNATGQVCDPARGPTMTRFVDVTSASGVAFAYSPDFYAFEGGGLAVVDLDGDGLPDIVTGSRMGGLTLFRNRGSLHFEKATDAGIDPTAAASAIAAADLDNDGDTDLVVASPAGVMRVLANQGDGRFVETAQFQGVGLTEHVLPVDLDGDGLLDLYVSNRDIIVHANTTNRLYMNRGGLQFAFAGALGDGLSWTATAFDFDGDGDQDLYVANDTLLADFGRPVATSPQTTSLLSDLFLRNDGPGPDGIPRFTDIAESLGLTVPRSSMGGVLGDFDGDGRLDLFVPNLGAKKLFLRDAAGGFVESANRLGVTAIFRENATCNETSDSESCLVLTWSAALGDFDLDGREEMLLVNGETVPKDLPPMMVLSRGAELPYRELAPSLSCSDARGVIVTDLDGDGDQDIVIAPLRGPLMIYENQGTPATNGWLHVTLHGKESNRDGIGAVVMLRMASGRTQSRIVGSGGVIHSANPAEAVFGLGTESADAVTVRWPSGRTTELLSPPLGSLVLEEGP